MKNYQKGLLLLALVPGLGLTSCSDESPWSGSDDMGGIYLDLESDGRVMQRTSRADDTMCPIVPDPNAFGISLYNADNSYNKTWATLEGFNKESGFPMGDYTIEAAYGDVNQEGFELPCFKGSNTVHVAPGAETPVSISATLANAMVSVRYTDKFTENFPNYSAAVQTAGHDWVVFAQDENRPAFIDASGTEDVKLSVTMTNGQDKTVTVEPASFKVQPRHHYVITINATGNVSHGDLVLSIEFSEDVVTENVNINLGDDLFNAPAPEVRAKGFEAGTPISKLAYDELTENPEFNLFAFGGFNEVTLNVITEEGSYAPTFGSMVQLVNAEALTQSQLANEGVKVSGLFKNQDKMAVVNVKKFLENLPAGKYKIQVQAKDAMTRLSEPVELAAEIGEMTYSMTAVAATPAKYLDKELTLDITSNSDQVKNEGRMTFRVDGRNAAVKSVTAVTTSTGKATRAGEEHTYRFVLDVPEITKDKVTVVSNYGKKGATADFAVAGPEYTVDVDAFAKFVVFKINAADDIKSTLTKNVEIYNGSAQITSNVKRDADNGLITISGLNASTDYSNYKLRIAGAFEKGINQFTTEAPATVPNGDFANAGRRIQIGGLQVGGEYYVTLFTDHHHTSSIDRTEPQGWATVNDLTAYENSSNKNTWFIVPSMFLENGVATVRSVGYNHNGTTPEKTGSAAGTTYYCTSAPTNDQLDKASGELFLGSYTYDGTEHRTKGTAFASRPTSVSFEYKYSPLNGEQAQADVEVLDASGAVLASGTTHISASPNMTTKTIDLPKYAFGKKAAKLYISFRSTKAGTTPAINIPKGSALNEGTGRTGTTLPANTYHALATGSELTVDNVKVSYDGVPTITK